MPRPRAEANSNRARNVAKTRTAAPPAGVFSQAAAARKTRGKNKIRNVSIVIPGRGRGPRARNPGTQAHHPEKLAGVHGFRAWPFGPSRKDVGYWRSPDVASVYLRRKYSSYGVSFLIITPPSTVNATPVIMRAAGPARNRIGSAISSGSHMRPSGIFCARTALVSGDGIAPPNA